MDGIARELFGTTGYCSVCGKKTTGDNKQCDRCLENSRRTIRIAINKSFETENYFRREFIL